MATAYTEHPLNWDLLAPYVATGTDRLIEACLTRKKCFFYDTCSFRRHANLQQADAEYIYNYMKAQDGMVIITRCILMELASYSGKLNPESIMYCKALCESGIEVLVIYEEDIYAVMEMCYSTCNKINRFLSWSVRMLQGPVSTITKTLDENRRLYEQIIMARKNDYKTIYKSFFSMVRANKEPKDNLGEELLAICLHILSHLPGEVDGKFCVITDDRGAASKIDGLFARTNHQFRGSKIIIFSTPKLVQTMNAEEILIKEDAIVRLLSAGISGNLTVLGTQIYDLKNREISLSCEEAAQLIMRKEIHIVF